MNLMVTYVIKPFSTCSNDLFVHFLVPFSQKNIQLITETNVTPDYVIHQSFHFFGSKHIFIINFYLSSPQNSNILSSHPLTSTLSFPVLCLCLLYFPFQFFLQHPSLFCSSLLPSHLFLFACYFRLFPMLHNSTPPNVSSQN